MKKKIKHVSKFVLSFLLICSFGFNSIATGSDGSAFVTKEEFDKALADFNTRITIFESGINSKIDSQVTSYLDRNGIWNSKDQDIKNVTTSWIGLLGSGSTPSSSYHLYHYRWDSGSTSANYSSAGGLGTSQLFENKSGTEKSEVILNKITKSGLCYLVFDCDDYVIRTNGTFPSDSTAPANSGPVRLSWIYNGAWACWDVGFKLAFKWNIVQYNPLTSTESPVKYAIAVTYPMTLAGANFKSLALDKYVCTFFVDRDEQLKVKSKVELEQYRGSSNHCELVCLDNKSCLAHRLRVNICDVY